MAEYIEREALLAEYDRLHTGEPGRARKLIAEAPAADVVEVDNIAEMFYEAFGCDDCPCNYNSIDEWLPMLCGVDSFCGRHDDKLHCWKLFIKHYGARMDGEG